MHLPDHIATQVAAAIAALRADILPDRVGRAHDAIPLYADIGGAVLLRADGVFLELEWDEPSEQSPREVAAPTQRVALVAGTERYPWLEQLLPRRPSNAVFCRDCEGQGRIFVDGASSRVAVYCGYCDGLGWRAI